MIMTIQPYVFLYHGSHTNQGADRGIYVEEPRLSGGVLFIPPESSLGTARARQRKPRKATSSGYEWLVLMIGSL